jgi:hypothetical protein
MNHRMITWVLLLSAPVLLAQQTQKASQQQSQSTIAYKNDNRTESVEIQNVAYELVGPGIPGRPKDERLVLRKTTHMKQVVDEIGMDATTTVEAWPLGVDLKDKPLYAVTASGVEPVTMNSDVLVISRGVEEVQWWSVYKLGNGQHLFDTYVPVVQFSTTRDIQTLRYAGLEVPPDDASDPRLKAPNVVAVLSYASGDRVIREALITADDRTTARLLRSYADATRTLAFTAGTIRLTISQGYPSAPKTATISVPIARDDLDLARTQLPAGLHIATWKR